MVVPKRDSGNIHFSTSAITSTMTQMAFIPASEAMDIDSYIDNYDNIRGRTSSPSKAGSRSASMSSSILLEPYCEKMEHYNDLPDEDFRELVNSSQLFYNDNSKEGNQVSKATDQKPKERQQHALEELSALNTMPTQYVDDDIINIQLPYNPNRPTKPDLWDGNFQPIFLHGSLEHLSSDFKNIKELLICLAKYIGNMSGTVYTGGESP